ncbi:SAM-dependent methyltransferase [Spongiactinospora gelatinilytica]|uniref:SAM-dependent methyltransferase n=1 Tax=Spongiactinospora gelatinilytica TaxID=2666298 RepID=A0A2W2F1N6_9ACTN|nr:class I SAM-dependent methyltransferase [Spongiactinospora gelatinilytica]PZG29301.1 SAM-dependent methyltransferase [Spongiactinospora gelatinilytica]
MTDHALHHHRHPAPPSFGPENGDTALLLDLDAEIFQEHLAELTAWLADLTEGAPVRRILDVGSGTGTGSFALLRHFADAEVIALDKEPHLLAHLRDKARDLGRADRVRTVAADLDATWPAVGEVDLVWASASLHHMADPAHALRQAYAALRHGGLLAVVERDGPPRLLPDDLGVGRPGLEARCRAALDRRHNETMPYRGADWAPLLTAAGFAVEAYRKFEIDLRAPLPESTGRYAQLALRRIRTGLATPESPVDTDDLSVLDLLIDGEGSQSVLHRDDLTVRSDRDVWTARKPA